MLVKDLLKVLQVHCFDIIYVTDVTSSDPKQMTKYEYPRADFLSLFQDLGEYEVKHIGLIPRYTTRHIDIDVYEVQK